MKARRQRKARFFGDDGQINQDLSKQTLLHLSPFYVEPFPLMLGVLNRKRGKPFDFPLFVGVRWARLELAQDYSHYPLKVACLPFHHHRFVLGLQRYEQFLNFQIFLQVFSTFFEISLKSPVCG